MGSQGPVLPLYTRPLVQHICVQAIGHLPIHARPDHQYFVISAGQSVHLTLPPGNLTAGREPLVLCTPLLCSEFDDKPKLKASSLES